MPAKGSKIWTKEDVLQESKKYTSRTEFAHGSPGAYQAACKKGWLAEMTWLALMHCKKWTKAFFCRWRDIEKIHTIGGILVICV